MDVLRQVSSVLLVFALLGAALWALRRSAGRIWLPGGVWKRTDKRHKSIVVLERVTLTPQHSLHIVRVQGRELAMVTHPHGCTVLTESAAGAGV